MTASVSPASARVGQPVYLPHTPGRPRRPRLPPATTLDRVSQLSIKPEVAWLDTQTSVQPPTRVFRYRLTPRAPGEVRLPPVLVSWFDPRSSLFQTSVGPAVDLTVRTAPAFDPSLLEYEARAAPSASPGRIRLQPPHLAWPDMRVWLAACLALPALALAASSYRRRPPRRQVPRQLRAALRG